MSVIIALITNIEGSVSEQAAPIVIEGEKVLTANEMFGYRTSTPKADGGRKCTSPISGNF